MEVCKLDLDGIKIFIPPINNDSRGSFTEKLNINQVNGFNIKQINQSISHKNVFRGFHFQKNPKEQAKYVWVERGAILDIVINIQPDSPDYKKHLIIELTDSNNYHLLIPKGFAHGFITLDQETLVTYKVNRYYNKNAEMGIIWNDPALAIDWPVSNNELTLSEKDRNLPLWNEIEDQVNF